MQCGQLKNVAKMSLRGIGSTLEDVFCVEVGQDILPFATPDKRKK